MCVGAVSAPCRAPLLLRREASLLPACTASTLARTADAASCHRRANASDHDIVARYVIVTHWCGDGRAPDSRTHHCTADAHAYVTSDAAHA